MKRWAGWAVARPLYTFPRNRDHKQGPTDYPGNNLYAQWRGSRHSLWAGVGSRTGRLGSSCRRRLNTALFTPDNSPRASFCLSAHRGLISCCPASSTFHSLLRLQILKDASNFFHYTNFPRFNLHPFCDSHPEASAFDVFPLDWAFATVSPFFGRFATSRLSRHTTTAAMTLCMNRLQEERYVL